MYSFEGEFRRRPEQRLSGNSVSQGRDQLLRRVQEQRRLRQQHQLRTRCAGRLQAFVRGCLTRARLRRQLRHEFDVAWTQLSSNPAAAACHRLAVQLCWLYRVGEPADWNRLLQLGQLLLRHQQLRDELSRRRWYGKLLALLTAGLSRKMQQVAVPLRLLELALTDGSAAAHLRQLVDAGYWMHVRMLVDSRLPHPDEETIQPPVPLAESVLLLVLRPLELAASLPEPCCRRLLALFASELLAPPLSPPVRYFVLPALSASGRFPFCRLLQALDECRAAGPADGRACPTRCVWLLYALLRLGCGALAGLSAAQLRCYVQLLDWAAGQLPLPAAFVGLPLSGPEDSDSDDDEMDAAPTTPDGGALQAALQVLNSAEHVQAVRDLLDASWEEPAVVTALCGLCYQLLNGDRLALHRNRLLYTLAFSRHFLRRLWTTVELCSRPEAGALLRVMSRGVELSGADRARLVPPLATFCAMFAHLLVTLQDDELTGPEPLFALPRLVEMSAALRDVYLGLVQLAYPDLQPTVSGAYSTALRGIGAASEPADTAAARLWSFLLRHVAGLLWQLQSRDSRLHFCPPDHWSSRLQPLPADRVPDVAALFRADVRRQTFRPFAGPVRYTRAQLEAGVPVLSSRDVRTMLLLRQLPFVFSFRQRVQLFQELLQQDKTSSQSEMDHFMTAGTGNSIHINIRRNYIYEDAFEKLSPENEPSLKRRIRVTMVNAKGLDEAGIDGGGVFREFLSVLLKAAFDPNRGFFRITNNNQLYPNPHADLLFDNPTAHFYFIGRVLGKAIYEQMLVELPLAAFFLVKLLGRHSDAVDIHYLHSLDPEMYRNLMYLSRYGGEVRELELDFTVNVTELGESRVEELKPGGANTPVTSANCIQYIHLMADYKLNRQIQRQCAALRQGLADVVPLQWLQMFDHGELQTLVSGAPVPVDVRDLRANTRYSGIFSDAHPVVVDFWRVVDELDDRQCRQLLRFVTSCSRPPLLGFRELYPPFCIHSAGAGDEDRLPSASTCMNLLKLPEYECLQTMRVKLLYAIQAEAGFELS